MPAIPFPCGQMIEVHIASRGYGYYLRAFAGVLHAILIEIGETHGHDGDCAARVVDDGLQTGPGLESTGVGIDA